MYGLASLAAGKLATTRALLIQTIVQKPREVDMKRLDYCGGRRASSTPAFMMSPLFCRGLLILAYGLERSPVKAGCGPDHD